MDIGTAATLVIFVKDSMWVIIVSEALKGKLRHTLQL